MGRTLRATFDYKCVKQDGMYCEVKLLEAAKKANKTYSPADKTLATAKHLCIPCLKKHIDYSVQFTKEMIDFSGVPASEFAAAQTQVSALVDVFRVH